MLYLCITHNSRHLSNIKGNLFDLNFKSLAKKIVHWTLGGPWFNDQRKAGDVHALDWFIARDNAMKLWD